MLCFQPIPWCTRFQIPKRTALHLDYILYNIIKLASQIELHVQIKFTLRNLQKKKYKWNWCTNLCSLPLQSMECHPIQSSIAMPYSYYMYATCLNTIAHRNVTNVHNTICNLADLTHTIYPIYTPKATTCDKCMNTFIV